MGEIVSDLIADARARAEADRREAASRGPVARLLLSMALLAFVSAGVTTVYGIYNFLDAPIRPAGGGYASKTGAPRTREAYERYRAWTRAMWTTYPATFLLASAFMWADDRGRRKRRNGAR